MRILAVGLLVILAGCAERPPEPVRVVQAKDRTVNCPDITTEVQANNGMVQELAAREGLKVVQNVAHGVAGVLIPVWSFGPNPRGAFSQEAVALQYRQKNLAALAGQRCTPVAPY